MLPEVSRKLRLAYFAHTFRSDWNNGNAHFLRGLMRAMKALGHEVMMLEPDTEWSIENLRLEIEGAASLKHFSLTYPDLSINTYEGDETRERWLERLRGIEIVLLHEWTTPAFAQWLLTLRDELGFCLLFHDTHHRASTSPDQIERMGLHHFDGVITFGESLRAIYSKQFRIKRLWVLHEAADTSVFYPQSAVKDLDAVWIGNWAEGERSAEIDEFFLKPAAALADRARFIIYGVRYPEHGLRALEIAHVRYGGYLPNLQAPATYGAARLTVHIPRQQYNSAMTGIPTIRVFETLACGIPLISAPWTDVEHLFRPDDFRVVTNSEEMISAMRFLLDNPSEADAQAKRGLQTVLARHTCAHRAQELTAICKELLS